nr:unnamed protein product [Callosobruchus analis]
MLEEMLARRKSTGETMSTYYHEKLALCSRVGIAGDNAVSCIIRGLPAELRANAQAARCRTPQALYNDILAGLESYGRVATHPKAAATRVGVPSKAVAPTPRERARCYNCQQITTHLSKDCPMPAAERCRGCGDRGHMVGSCPKRRGVRGRGAGDRHTAAKKVSLLLAPDNKCFRHLVYIGGSGVKAYIDTGCEANLMALATAERLGLEMDPNGAGQLLQGFGGGHALSRGSVIFEMTLAGCQIELTALVTEADMGQIELLLGQATLNTPGVTMVVRGGRIYLTTKPNIEEFFANITLEEDGGRCRVILAEDVTLLPDSVNNVDVEVHGVPGVEYFMDKKSFPHRRSAILIPAGVLKGERGRIKIINGGEETILWRKGRLVARSEACRPEPRRESVVRVRAINVFNDLDLSNVVIGDVTGECDRLYVPAMAKFGVLGKYHDDIGHPATERCLAVLAGTYWFPKMRRFVSKYVKSCLRCAKGQYGRGEGLLHPIERWAIPFDTVHVDHLGPFVKSVRGNSYILILVDGFTKFVVAKPCKTLRSSEAIARLSEVFGEFGIPRRVVTDQGKAFKSKEFKAFGRWKGRIERS